MRVHHTSTHSTFLLLLKKAKSEKSYWSKKSKKSDMITKKELIADMGSMGEISVYFEDDEMMSISYELEDMPEKCEDCYIAIHARESCNSPGKEYWDSAFNDDRRGRSSKWERNGAITASKYGHAAGMIMDIDNKYSYSRNKCNAIIVYDEDGDEMECAQLVPKNGEC